MRKLIFLLFLATAHLAYSQTTYPKQTVLEGDSVIVITHHHMDLINLAYLTIEEQQNLIGSYDRQLRLYQHNEVKFEELVQNLYNQIDNYQLSIEEYNQIIDELNQCLKKDRRRIQLLKATRTIYTIAGVVGGVYIGYMASNFLPLI